MLDAVRYLIVWNPVILIALHFLLHELGLDKGLQSSPEGVDGFNSTNALNSSLGYSNPNLLNGSSGVPRLF